MVDILIECLDNRNYDIIEINTEDNNDGVVYEFWVREKENKKVYCYYFFPYDMGVIEVGEDDK